VGDNEACVQQALHLQKEGFYVLPVRPPTVAIGTARLRFSFTATIQKNEINQLIAHL
jgi:8-amino-7-oxononanoate synthase